MGWFTLRLVLPAIEKPDEKLKRKFNVCHPKMFNKYKYTMIYQTQQNFIMFIIALGLFISQMQQNFIMFIIVLGFCCVWLIHHCIFIYLKRKDCGKIYCDGWWVTRHTKVGLLHRKQPQWSFRHCGPNRLPWMCMGRIQHVVRQVKSKTWSSWWPASPSANTHSRGGMDKTRNSTYSECWL